MKILLFYLASLSGIVACNVSPSTSTASAKPVAKTIPGFAADSGYITVQNLHKSFVITPRDTLFKPSEFYKPFDTIGKYYKMVNGNFIASVSTMNRYKREVIILCEATKTGKVLKAEEFDFGNYSCCWDTKSDYLKKSGDYYIFTSCGTGSAYCGSDIYVFKDVKPQDEQGGAIFRSAWGWTGNGNEYTDVHSKMEITGDTIMMHYTFELYKEGEGRKRKTKKRVYRDARYTKQDGEWTTHDSMEINEFWYAH